MNRKLTIYLILALAAISACAGNSRKQEIPTGVITHELPEGGLEFVSTAKASPHAIQSNLFSLKRTTSCDAARLLIKIKFEELGYDPAGFQKGQVFLLRGATYCRILGVFKPASKTKSAK